MDGVRSNGVRRDPRIWGKWTSARSGAVADPGWGREHRGDNGMYPDEYTLPLTNLT